MAFAISAYFPLGFYQGSDSGGRPEEFPSLCRLYSALVSVAYLTFGFEQVDANRNLTDDQIREALNWLEDNPPQGMLLPHAVKADSRAVAYRNKGNVQNRKKPKDKVSSTTAHIATAYEQHPESGRLLTWIWHECPSSTARMVLSWLCNEVPYLGEACSPVELNTYEDYVLPSGVDEQLWTLSPDSALTNIRKRGKPVAYPKKGRLDDLKQAFVAANPKPKGKKNLTVSDKEDEQNFLNEYPLAQTEGKARYLSSAARKQREVLKAPWVMALYLEINAIACNGDIVIDVTRNGREQVDCPVLPSMTGWISSSIPFFHQHGRFNSVDEELVVLNAEYEEMLQQETAWNSFRANSPHVYPEACPTFFLNVTRSSHKNEVSPLSTNLTRGSTYPYSYGYPIEVRAQYFNDEAKVSVSCNTAYFSREKIRQFLEFFKDHLLLTSHILANTPERE